MICGERGIVMPDADPRVMLDGRHACFFATLGDDMLMDCFLAYREHADPTNKIDCILVDVVRAEFARRHAPASPAVARGCWPDLQLAP